MRLNIQFTISQISVFTNRRSVTCWIVIQNRIIHRASWRVKFIQKIVSLSARYQIVEGKDRETMTTLKLHCTTQSRKILTYNIMNFTRAVFRVKMRL